MTSLGLKTAAEKYIEFADTSPTPTKQVLSPDQRQGTDDDPNYGDVLKLDLTEVDTILQLHHKIGPHSESKRKWQVPTCLQNPCYKCTQLIQHGYLRGKRRSLKKQHITQFFAKQMKNKRIEKDKNAYIMDGCSDLTVTYRELDEISNAIAHILLNTTFSKPVKNHNPEGHPVIAVCLPVCYEYVILIQAILKLGAAILPLNTEYPVERITEMIKLTRPMLILCSMEYETVLQKVKEASTHVDFDLAKVEDLWDDLYNTGGYKQNKKPLKNLLESQDPELQYPPLKRRIVAIYVIPSDTQDLQMVAYDSRVFLNRLKWEDHVFVYVKNEYCLLPPSFDTIDALGDVIVQLCMGATLVGLRSPVEYRIPDMLFLYCEKYKLKRLFLWPTLLKACMISMRLFEDFIPMVATVKYWMCVGGGCIRTELAQMFFELPLHPLAQLVHMYHFEDTAGALAFQIYENMGSLTNQSYYSRLPVGYPVPNTSIYILDANMKPVNDGESGAIYVSSIQSPRVSSLANPPNSYYIHPNPFSKSKDRQLLIRTLDYGKIMTRSNGTRVLVHEVSRDKHYFVDNQIVWLLHLDMYLGRLTNLVKQFHTICYRPNEDDQTLLAFCVLQPKITADEVESQLKQCLPFVMVPEIVPVTEIPLVPDREHQIDENTLLKMYITKRIKRQQFDKWQTLGISDPVILRAAKILAYVIYSILGVPISEIVGKYWSQPYINLKQATPTKAVFIVKELHANRYPLYTDEFFFTDSLKLIPNLMIEARKTRGYCNRNCPPEEVFFIKNRYRLEIMVNHNRYIVCGLLARSFTQRDQLDYFAEVEDLALRKYFDSIWPLFVEKKLSILIRRKKDGNKLVGAVLNMNWFDEIKLIKSQVPTDIGYKLELIQFLESSLNDSHFPQDKTHVLQICYIGMDAKILTQFEIHGLTDKIIRSMLIIGKVKGFEALVIITYDYFTTDICVNNYFFNIAKQVQVNQFIASDGTRPYELAPDTMYATLCWKSLNKVSKADTNRRVGTLRAAMHVAAMGRKTEESDVKLKPSSGASMSVKNEQRLSGVKN